MEWARAVASRSAKAMPKHQAAPLEPEPPSKTEKEQPAGAPCGSNRKRSSNPALLELKPKAKASVFFAELICLGWNLQQVKTAPRPSGSPEPVGPPPEMPRLGPPPVGPPPAPTIPIGMVRRISFNGEIMVCSHVLFVCRMGNWICNMPPLPIRPVQSTQVCHCAKNCLRRPWRHDPVNFPHGLMEFMGWLPEDLSFCSSCHFCLAFCSCLANACAGLFSLRGCAILAAHFWRKKT